MSEFHAHLGNYDQQQQYYEPQGTSGMAIASLVCSLIACCPLITILGPVLGAVALVQIGSPPRRKGKMIAIAGIIIGLITTVISSAGGYWLLARGLYFMEGPVPALDAGHSGDITGFKSHFRDGARYSDEEVHAFLNEMIRRYGPYQSARYYEQGDVVDGRTPGTAVATYVAQYSNKSVQMEAELNIFTLEVEYILVRDPDEGDIRFPPLP